MKNIDDYHDLHVESNTLLLADTFENLRDTFLKYTGRFGCIPGLAWFAALKKTNIQLELLTDTEILFMLEPRIISSSVVLCYTKANEKYMKNYNENKRFSCSPYSKKKSMGQQCLKII